MSRHLPGDPIDRLLDSWRIEPPSPDLAARIATRSRDVPQLGRRLGWREHLAALLGGSGDSARLVPQLAGLGLALLIGFWYGAGGVANSTAQEIDASQLILGPNIEAEWQG